MSSFRDLRVWQRSMDLAEEIYRLIKKLPKSELYVMSDQMRRAAISIPSNIAEGQERNSKKEFGRFLSIALASKAELETQLEICIRVGYFTREEIRSAMELIQEIGKMLNGFIVKLRNS